MRAILTWHSIDPSGSPISVSREDFAQQLVRLAAASVRVVPVEVLLTLPEDADAVALTFDDGFVNFKTEAVPLLQSRGWPATLFVTTARVGLNNQWENSVSDNSPIPVLPLLDWDSLGRLRESGIAVGAHGRTHRHLTMLAPDELTEELGLAADDLHRRLGESPKGMAYPYGDFNDRIVDEASRYYRYACTTELKTLSGPTSLLRLPRLDSYYFRDSRLLLSWGSWRFRTWCWSRHQARRVRDRFTRRGALRPSPRGLTA